MEHGIAAVSSLSSLRPIGATVARQIPVLKVTRSNRVSVTHQCWLPTSTVHPQVVRDLLPGVPPSRRRLRAPQVALALPPRGRRAAPSRGDGRQGGGTRRRGATRVAGRVARVARRHRQGARRVRQVGGGPVRSLLLSPDHSRHKPRPRSPFERNSQTSAHKLLILNILSGGGFPSLLSTIPLRLEGLSSGRLCSHSLCSLPHCFQGPSLAFQQQSLEPPRLAAAPSHS